MEELLVSSLFKIFLVLLSVASFLYAVLVERDIVKGLLILNIITNYRVILFHLTDFQSEIMNRREVVYKLPTKAYNKEEFKINRELKFPVANHDQYYYAYDYPLSKKAWWEAEI